MSYQERWVSAACVAVALGVGFATLEWDPVGVVLTVAILWAGARIARAAWGSPEHQKGWQRSFLAGPGVVALWGLVSASPPLALLALLVVATTSPASVRLLCGHSARASSPVPANVAQMTDTDLRRLWRRTYGELRASSSVEELLDTVALRQLCLAEMERRNPSILRAWLASPSQLPGDADAR